jgi:hypothetical protein
VRSERGIALTVAMFAVVLIGVFSAVLASAAVQLSDTSTADRDDKRALQAAQAGLAAAFHRLNAQGHVGVPNLLDLAQFQVHLQCIGLGAIARLPGVDECPRGDSPGAGGSGQAGTGTRYRYTVTPVLAGDDCDDTFVPNSQTLVTQLAGTLTDLVERGILRGPGNDEDPLYLFRCITATGETVAPDGTVTGRVRLQERVATPFGITANIIGTEEVTVDGLGTVVTRPLGSVVNSAAGVVGTNGTVRISNNAVVQTDVSHPDPGSNPVALSSGGSHAGQVRKRTPDWYLPRVNPGNSASSNSNGWTTCLNVNLLLVQFRGCDYDAGSRTLHIHGVNVLSIGTANVVTLRAGIHNYCRVIIDGGLLPTTVIAAQSRVFIDPESCPNSVPAAERGTLRINGLVVFAELNELSPYSGFFVKGTPPGGGPGVRIDGAGVLNLQVVKTAIYAPETTIDIRNGAKVLGAYYAKRVEFRSGATYAALPVLGDLKLNILGAVQHEYARMGWVQCRAVPADPGNEESC